MNTKRPVTKVAGLRARARHVRAMINKAVAAIHASGVAIPVADLWDAGMAEATRLDLEADGLVRLARRALAERTIARLEDDLARARARLEEANS